MFTMPMGWKHTRERTWKDCHLGCSNSDNLGFPPDRGIQEPGRDIDRYKIDLEETKLAQPFELAATHERYDHSRAHKANTLCALLTKCAHWHRCNGGYSRVFTAVLSGSPHNQAANHKFSDLNHQV